MGRYGLLMMTVKMQILLSVGEVRFFFCLNLGHFTLNLIKILENVTIVTKGDVTES